MRERSEVVSKSAVDSFNQICLFQEVGGCAYIRLGEACLAGSRLEHPDRIDCETCCTPVFCDVVWESQQRRLPYGARLGMRRVDFEKVVRNENNKTKTPYILPTKTTTDTERGRILFYARSISIYLLHIYYMSSSTLQERRKPKNRPKTKNS